jgi:hypothetical protein
MQAAPIVQSSAGDRLTAAPSQARSKPSSPLPCLEVHKMLNDQMPGATLALTRTGQRQGVDRCIRMGTPPSLGRDVPCSKATSADSRPSWRWLPTSGNQAVRHQARPHAAWRLGVAQQPLAGSTPGMRHVLSSCPQLSLCSVTVAQLHGFTAHCGRPVRHFRWRVSWRRTGARAPPRVGANGKMRRPTSLVCNQVLVQQRSTATLPSESDRAQPDRAS